MMRISSHQNRHRNLRRLVGLALAGGACILIARRRRRSEPAPSGGVFSPRMRAIVGAFNRFTLRFAGRRFSPFAVVHHVGRRSGRTYTTPVVTRRLGATFVMGLPYGPTVDWMRNLQHQGQGTLRWRGQSYAVGRPEVVGFEEVMPAFSPVEQLVCRAFGWQEFARFPVLAPPVSE